MRTTALCLAIALLIPSAASAYTTRMHILIANDIHAALVESGDGSVQLIHSDYAVQLSDRDARALENEPLAFRAGAVGPDNTVFPGMTDPSHAVTQRPYDQCQLLYEEALTDEEIAYAIGCFLHGATDAVAHHYVNYLTGETFTLNPISEGRESSFSNVVRHIAAETMIQDSAVDARPEMFRAGTLTHSIPTGFVLRTYFDDESVVWQLMARHALAEFEEARDANPDGSIVDAILGAGLAPADYLVLLPVFIDEIETTRADARADMEARIAELQDPLTDDGFELFPSAGDDGVLGTMDDETDCTATCPILYADYFVRIALLAPRMDAGGRELPSAFDVVSNELGADIRNFPTVLLQTIQNLSGALNSPIDPSDEQGWAFDSAEIDALLAPMTTWADDLVSIDYATLTSAILPDWLLSLEATLDAVGVDIDLAGYLELLIEPIVAPIRDAIVTYAIGEATEFIEELLVEYELGSGPAMDEFQAILEGHADPELAGTMLDSLFFSGLYAHSFNLAVAVIGNHELILPDSDLDDDLGVGPSSFDASHTLQWTQAGLCDYLRDAIFPLGLELSGLLSVRSDQDYPAVIDTDSPVECHDGSLSEFGAPNTTTCAHTDLEALLADPVGCLSRAYPPTYSGDAPVCRNLVVAGLPDPPEPMEDVGTDVSSDVGADTTDAEQDPGGNDSGEDTAGGDTAADTQDDTPDNDGDSSGEDGGSDTAEDPGGGSGGSGGGDGGCGCSSAPGPPGNGWLLLLGVGLIVAARRRRAWLALVAAFLMACGGGSSPAMMTAATPARMWRTPTLVWTTPVRTRRKTRSTMRQTTSPRTRRWMWSRTLRMQATWATLMQRTRPTPQTPPTPTRRIRWMSRTPPMPLTRLT